MSIQRLQTTKDEDCESGCQSPSSLACFQKSVPHPVRVVMVLAVSPPMPRWTKKWQLDPLSWAEKKTERWKNMCSRQKEKSATAVRYVFVAAVPHHTEINCLCISGQMQQLTPLKWFKKIFSYLLCLFAVQSMRVYWWKLLCKTTSPKRNAQQTWWGLRTTVEWCLQSHVGTQFSPSCTTSQRFSHILDKEHRPITRTEASNPISKCSPLRLEIR